MILGGAVSQALERRAEKFAFRLLHRTEFGPLADALALDSARLERDAASGLLGPSRQNSRLYEAIADFGPDVLIVEGSWFVFHDLLHDIDAYKIGLFFGMLPGFFHVNAAGRELRIQEWAYDRVFAIEPFDPPFPAEHLNPILLRNPDEILPREEAAARLDIDPDQPTAFIAINGRPGEFENLKKTYSYLEEEYQAVYSSNYHGGIFPAVDYYNAFDFIVCGAGYSQFWEAIYFEKEAVFVPQPRRFESQAWRVENCQDYRFTENGADQLARIIADL